jgi:very-short-patch-repair endonuclease
MSRFEKDDNEFLIDLLLETNMSLAAIARELELPVAEVKKKIDILGLGWIKDTRKKYSRGQAALTAIMQKILVGEKVVNEFVIIDNMRLDVYCERYKIAAEYHGRQHFYYTSRFFESRYEFEQAQDRDIKKVEYCKENGISLIVFRYNDLLTEDAVYQRMLQAIRDSGCVPKVSTKKSIASSDYYLQAKKRNSDYKKQLYKKMKDSKNNGAR